ncbi:MAG: hypothetical protein ACYCWE_03760 [Eubacteriales bacterium]
MHDTFLNQNLYDAIVSLCDENSISKIDDIIITVHTDSHISEDSLREQFAESSNNLIDGLTEITVQRKDIQRLTAFIEHIGGEKRVKKER